MSPSSSQSSQSTNQTVPTAHVPTEGLVSPDRVPVRRALVSVYDKTGLVPLARALADAARPGDVLLTIGAGDVTRLGPVILERLEQVGRPGASQGDSAQ